MIIKRIDMGQLNKICETHNLACFGIGNEFRRIITNYKEYPWTKRIKYLVDSDNGKENEVVLINNNEYKIMSFSNFLNEDLDKIVILITCLAFYDLICQLNSIKKLDNIECYLFHFMFGIGEGKNITIRNTQELLIPKRIHYCWFGKNELPDLYKRCIESWKKYCPDYEIVEWNESNCDVSETVFTKQAYETGKYGFVPDYFRLKIIYENGGIYLDTDVELLKSLDDLCFNEAFCGMEYPGEVALGLGFGAVKGHPVIKKMMERYFSMHFIRKDGSYDETISPVYQSEDLKKIGLLPGNKNQNINGLCVYPIEVLSPKNIITGSVNITENSYALHHYDGSWVSGKRLEQKKRRQYQVEEIEKMFVD